MSATSVMASLPLALGGESVTNNSTGLAIISVVSLVVGYLALFALWYFVFRDKSRSKRKRDPSD